VDSQYAQTLTSLFARSAFGFKLGLESPRALFDALGRPEQRLRAVVLVAGTNGKGSTAALIAGTLQRAGLRTGFFLSPHLLRFCERIRVGSEMVTPQQVSAMYDEIRAVEHLCPQRPTFFECATAMAVMTFVRHDVDIAVFEVGLGGRLDATNVLPRQLAVITPIGLDHQHFLGDTLAQIAGEKADIIPASGTVVMAEQTDEARAVIEAVAQKRGARVARAPEVSARPGCLVLDRGDLHGPLTLRIGEHAPYQRVNIASAAAATQALAALGHPVTPGNLQEAIDAFDWPARYQWLGHGGVDTLVDGAHNPAAVDALCNAMSGDARTFRPAHCVFSALRDKAAESMLARLRPWVRSLHLCPLPSRRRRSLEDLSELAPEGEVHGDVYPALAAARQRAAVDGGFVLVTGSLMLAGAVLAEVTGAPRDPTVDG
jgi:dihydrofolate synthase/folylpolyglutamate synthase